MEMQSENIFAAFKKILPETIYPDVVAAFRQDPLVWDSLTNDELFNKFIEVCEENTHLVNPATVALLAINYPGTSLELQALPLIPLDPTIRQNAAHVYEETFRSLKSPSTIQEAGLLALALRERRRLTDAWQGLLTELQINPAATPDIQYSVWRTPLACLFSITPDALNLMRGLLPKPGALLHPSQIALVLHGLLSNPMTLREQVDLLANLVGQYSIEDQLVWLDNLETIGRTTLANELSKALLQGQARTVLNKNIEGAAVQTGGQVKLPAILSAVNARQQLATFFQKAGNPDESIQLLSETIQSLRAIEADLSNRIGEIAFTKNDPEMAVSAFKEAVALQPDSVQFHTDLAISLGETGAVEDAIAVLPETTADLNSLLAKAYLHFQLGEVVRAQELGRQAFSLTNDNYGSTASFKNNRLWKRPDQVVSIFTKIGLIDEAIQYGRKALVKYPSDGNLLTALGVALGEKGENIEAVDFLQTVVTLNPAVSPFRRLYASMLEKLGKWVSALSERTLINQSNPVPDIQDLSSLARCAIRAGQTEPAINASQAILNLDPENGLAHIFLGEASQLENDAMGALQHFTQATLLNPEEPEAWLALSKFQKANGDPYKSLETLRAGSHAAPHSAEIQYALAEEYLASGSPSEALPALRKANTLNPASPDIAIRLGGILRDLGHSGESKQVLERARRTFPTNPDLAYAHGLSLIALGETDAAIPAIITALEADPKEIEPYLVYARIVLDTPSRMAPGEKGILALNELDSSYLHKALANALNIDPANREANLLMAQAQVMSGDLESALKRYQELVEMPADHQPGFNWKIRLGLGKTALALQQYDTALASLQEAAILAPNEVSVHQALTGALEALDLKNESLESAKTALNLAPQNKNVLNWYAKIVHEIGSHSECIATLERAVELDPSDPETTFNLARVHVEADNPQSAAETLEALLKQGDLQTADLVEMSHIWLTIGDTQAARECIEKAIQNDENQTNGLWFTLSLINNKIGDTDQALEASQKAAYYQPDDPNIMAFQADLLNKMNRNQASLACYEQSLKLFEKRPQTTRNEKSVPEASKITELPTPDFLTVAFDVVKTHMKMAKLYQSQGELNAALTHAEKALELDPERYSAHALAADLASALLDNETALALAQIPSLNNSEQDWIQSAKNLKDIDRSEIASLLSIKGELELEANDISNALIDVTKALDLVPNYARALAVHACIDIANGDFKSAEQHWEEAIANLNSIPQGIQINGKTVDETPAKEPAADGCVEDKTENYPTLTLAKAALAVEQWDTALALFDLAADKSPMEPRTHLALAKAIVVSAETQKNYTSAGVITHAPGDDKLSEKSAAAFENAIQAANQLSSHSQINRWNKRGQAVFHPNAQSLRSLANLPSCAEDIAAAIAVCRDLDDLDTALNFAKFYPNHPQVCFQLALAQRQKSIQKAALTAEKLVSNPQAHPVHLALFADLASKTDNELAGLEAIDTALEIWPNEPEWQALAAKLSDACQEPDAVIDHLSKAYTLDPNNPDYAHSLGKAYLQANRVKEAIQYLETATRMEPDLSDAWLTLAMAYQASNDTQRAVACAEKAISISPDQVDPLIVCGEIALAADQMDLVHKHAEAALNLDPANPQALLLLVKALDVEGEPQEALEALDQFIPTTSDAYPLKIQRAMLIRKTQPSQAAAVEMETLNKEYPEDPWILSQLAEVMAETGQREPAEKYAQASLRLQPKQPKLHLLVGRLQRTAGQLDQAILHLNEAIQQSPQLIDAYLDLGKAYQDRRENTQALQIYKKSIQISPKDPRPYYQAGLALKDSKDYTGAEAMLRKAADLAPDDLNIHRQLGAIIAINLVHNPQEASA